MAREDKPLKLIPVDDEVVKVTPVIRLDNPETERKERDVKPVKLGAVDEPADVSRRLDLPAKEEVELRTHQPGIDVLIEPEPFNPDLLEQAWGEATVQRNPIPWGWFALIGIAIAGAVIWSLTRVEIADDQVHQLRKETQTVLVDDEKEDREAAALIDRIEGTVRKVFLANSVESLAPLIRHPDRVTPLMRAFYGNKPVYLGKINSVRRLEPLTLDRRGDFWMSTVSLAGEGNRSLIVEILPSGEPKVDWETLVCHQPMKWDDFATQRPTGTSMDFRVYVEQDNFYSHEFSNSAQWVSFRLTALGGDETMFGYAHAGSPEAEQLAGLVRQSGGRPATLILRLAIPQGLQSRRGVVIEKVMNSRWLYIDPPDSEP